MFLVNFDKKYKWDKQPIENSKSSNSIPSNVSINFIYLNKIIILKILQL